MKFLQVDAFTSQAFRGNPAAVCLLDRERDAQWMQDVAAEMNLSETAFLLPRGSDFPCAGSRPPPKSRSADTRRSPARTHCGEEQLLAPTEIARFHTQSGLLTAERKGDQIELDFPATLEQPSDPPAGLLESLGIADPVYVGRNKFDYLVEVASEALVRSLDPEHAQLRKIEVRGVIVTARATETDADFISRFFAPGSGVDEDPVTGSAHCCLTPYWSVRLGKNEMTAYQASPRGGYVYVQLAGDRVKLRGHAVTVLRGELRV